jgi:acyl-coenzyme A synthetase/AMP-(fatty) acid ligase/3-hydroxymyristoyl/3-hydroxydecanoyl-(acyl carrier protein) dehydratase
VSQHHIYGLLFSILLPFTAGVPFRRTRIQYPEEVEQLTGDSYLLITVPAFLKRATEIENSGSLRLRSPWIFTSGGVLSLETAAKTERAFGFWPLEIYGSTETSGIAYRHSKNGLAWTPFDNTRIGTNDAGRLVVRSPYIRDPAGFTTGDEADILEDGRFILKGRADAIVKIEEKRISLPEVENRLIQSGLVADVSVVALEDRRQYLAAAIVLNAAGKERFSNLEKYEINRYFHTYLLQFFESAVLPKKWRYADALPIDHQGKKRAFEIRSLFAPSPQVNLHGITGERVLEKTDTSVAVELLIPGESEYFDGHFPEFKLLPGVAQIELVVRLAAGHFKTGIYVSKAKRIKFSNVIVPDSIIRVELAYNAQAGSVTFKITSPGGETIHAAGALHVGGPL